MGYRIRSGVDKVSLFIRGLDCRVVITGLPAGYSVRAILITMVWTMPLALGVVRLNRLK